MSAIGLFGGAFDPVHLGHLRLALEAAERLRLSAVRFLPLAGARHRDAPHAPGRLRRALLAAALAGEPRFMLDDRELVRGGVSYTVDTLHALRAELGPDTPLVWIMGMDSFASLPHWHRWSELEQLTHFAVACRPGAQLPAEPALAALLARARVADPAAVARRPAGAVALLELPMLDISASAIRAALAAGRSVRYLVPDAALHILDRSGAYRDER